MSESQSPTPAAPARKPRSSVERALVWGGILVLLAVVGVQAQARFGYDQSLKRTQGALEAKARSGQDSEVTISEMPGYLAGWYVTDRRKLGQVVYSWDGVFKSYGFTVTYDPRFDPKDGSQQEKDRSRAITNVITTNSPPETPPRRPKLTTAEHFWLVEWFPPATAREHPYILDGVKLNYTFVGFDPMRYDEDHDGKLTLKEAPIQMKATPDASTKETYFEKVDANKDGFVDQSEVEALIKKHLETHPETAATKAIEPTESK